MARASRRACPTPGCGRLTTGGRCAPCAQRAEQRRGTASQRGYTSRGHLAFRAAVLARDPICVVCRLAPSTVADHYPVSRRDLVASGRDADAIEHGRGVCATCHSTETTKHQPGGWHA